MVHWIIGKFYDKKGPNSKDESVISHQSPFRNRHSDIMAYRSNVCYQKGSPRVHRILGRLHAKKQGPRSRDKKVVSF